MINRTLVVFLCLVYCVTCNITGVHYVNPTPVLDKGTDIRSTDAHSPLKFNKEVEPIQFTTGISVLPSDNGFVDPTPVLKGFVTTDVANPMIRNDGVVILQSTRPSDIQPTSLIHVPVIIETDAKYPLNINNKPSIAVSTGIVADDFVNPTQVIKIKASQTIPLVPLTNEDPEAPTSTGNVYFIEPSSTLKVNEGSFTTVPTPNLLHKPNENQSTQVANPITESIAPCTCSFYEDIISSALNSFGPGYALTPHFITPVASKINEPHSAINIYQNFVNLHFNLFVNNIPVLAANVDPYYY